MQNLLWALLVAAALPSGGAYSVDASASTLRYTVVHKLHRVEGSSHDLEARAVVKDDGSVLTMVRLDAHHVERPSLLFVKIEDDCHVDFDLVLRGGGR